MCKYCEGKYKDKEPLMYIICSKKQKKKKKKLKQ